MNCPHCKTELVEHLEETAKHGAQHCYDCGCCFLADGKTVRVQTCSAEASMPTEAQPAPEEDVPAEPSRGRRR